MTGPCMAFFRSALIGIACCLPLALGACGNSKSAKIDPKYGVSPSPKVVADGKPVPRGGGRDHTGKPYKIAGKWYHPKEDKNYKSVGVASWYGPGFHGRKTANGEIFDAGALSAAHPTMPLPSYARVTNLTNGKSVVVRVNDRGPFSRSRIIDVSKHAAAKLDFIRQGKTKVKVEYVGRAPLHGQDVAFLEDSYRNGAGDMEIQDTQLAMANTMPVLPSAPSPAIRLPEQQIAQNHVNQAPSQPTGSLFKPDALFVRADVPAIEASPETLPSQPAAATPVALTYTNAVPASSSPAAVSFATLQEPAMRLDVQAVAGEATATPSTGLY